VFVKVIFVPGEAGGSTTAGWWGTLSVAAAAEALPQARVRILRARAAVATSLHWAVEAGYAATVAATRVPAGRPTRRRQRPSCRRCRRCCRRSRPSVAAGAMIGSVWHEWRRARNGAYEGGG